jgi:hypothetical protein
MQELLSGLLMTAFDTQVKDQIVPAAANTDNVISSPMSVDAAQRGDTLVKRCCGVDGLLLRWSQVRSHALIQKFQHPFVELVDLAKNLRAARCGKQSVCLYSLAVSLALHIAEGLKL